MLSESSCTKCKAFPVILSIRTVSRRLSPDFGLKSYKRAHKPRLTSVMKKPREAYAKSDVMRYVNIGTASFFFVEIYIHNWCSLCGNGTWQDVQLPKSQQSLCIVMRHVTGQTVKDNLHWRGNTPDMNQTENLWTREKKKAIKIPDLWLTLWSKCGAKTFRVTTANPSLRICQITFVCLKKKRCAHKVLISAVLCYKECKYLFVVSFFLHIW